MNTIKTIILTLVVTSIGYGAYLVITQEPPVAPEGAQDGWTEPPLIDLGNAQQGTGFSPIPGATTPAAVQGGTAPPFAPAPASDAPPYNPGGEAPSFTPASEPTAGTLPPPPDWASNPATPAPGIAPSAPAPTSDLTNSPPAAPAPAVAGDPFPAPGGPAITGAPTAPATDAFSTPAPGGPAISAAPTDAGLPPMPNAMTQPGQVPPVAPNSPVATPGAPATAAALGVSPPGTVAPATSFTAAMASVQAKLNAEQYVEAHRELSEWYERRELSEPERRQLFELLDALTGTVIYSRDFHAEPAYEVQPGDDLERIAQQYNIPWQFLQRINGVEDPRQLSPGQKLKVLRGPFRATVDLEAGQLTVWLNDRYAGRFPIGRNAPGITPEGEYEVKTKIENPAFYGADGTVEADDPANPLGERWIELSEQVGIHGSADLNAVLHADTAHCIRMQETDVEDLYDILSVGSKITVRR